LQSILPPVIAHRGAPRAAPENTLAAFAAARTAGAGWVEFDVMLSRDGVPVVHHDDDLQRLAGVPQAVAELTAAELQALDLGTRFDPAFAGEGLPTLEMVVGALAVLGLGANVEIKPAPGRERDTARAALAVLHRCWPRRLPPPLISSFSAASLEVAQAEAESWPRGYLVEELPPDWREQTGRLGCTALHLDFEPLSLEQLDAIRAAGLRTAVYTVNDPAVAARLYAWGVDCIIPDVPELILPLAG